MNGRLRPLIDPESIAIYGASANLSRLGGVPIALLRQHAFAGPVYPINPKYSEIDGLTCYPNIESLPGPVDLLVVAVSAPEVVPVLRRAARKGIRAAVVFAAGFAESGDEQGRSLQEELRRCAEETGLVVAGPNCMGFGNLDSHAYSTFTSIFRTTPPPDSPRDTVLITQSGSVCSAVYAAGRTLDVRFSVVVNTGNEACVEYSEYLEYLADRRDTQVIVGYVEGLRDGARFSQVAAKLRDEGRLLALLKAGETEKGAESVESHTAALAGDKAVYRAVFERLCVVPATDILHLADIAYLARFRHRVMGSKVAIMTISGALGALLADRFVREGLSVPTLSATVQSALETGIPRYGMVRNPIDFTGDIVNRHAFVGDALRVILGSDDVDQVVIYAPGFLLDRFSEGMIAAAERSPKMIVAISTGAVAGRRLMEDAGIAVFDDPSRAVQAVKSLVSWQEGHRTYNGDRTDEKAKMERPAGPADATRVRLPLNHRLNEHEGLSLLGDFGVPVAPTRTVGNADEAVAAADSLGYPVVLKISGRDFTHKSEAGGVRLNLHNPAAVRQAYADVIEAAKRHGHGASIEGVCVQRQQAIGVELLLGVRRDSVFGPVMTVGLGGVCTELFADVVHIPLPVSATIAARALRSLRSWPLLDGFRGAPKADVNAIAFVMHRLSNAVVAIGERFDEVEVNPLVAMPDAAVAVDCVLRLRHEGTAPAHAVMTTA